MRLCLFNIACRIRFSSPTGRTVSASDYQQSLDFISNPFIESEMSLKEPEPKKLSLTEQMRLEYPQFSIEMKNEDIIIQKSFDVMSKAMFGEIVGTSSDMSSENKDQQVNGKKEDEDDLKEIVESFFFSYRRSSNSEDVFKEEESSSASCNVNVIDTQNKSCDKDSEELNEINLVEVGLDCSHVENDSNRETIVDNSNLFVSKDQEVISNREEEESNRMNCDESCLDNFNSYNYWKLSPELPLDPLIVNGTKDVSGNGDHNNLAVSIECDFVCF